MTIEQVKDELPDITVWSNGKKTTARVRGRFERFATVYVPETGVDCQFAWGTVANSITKNITLEMDEVPHEK